MPSMFNVVGLGQPLEMTHGRSEDIILQKGYMKKSDRAQYSKVARVVTH
jgi:hypothetical protein